MRYIVFVAIALSLLLVFFVPAVNGISVTATQGNGNTGTSISMTYESSKKDIVEQHIEVNPSAGELDNSWYFSGPGSTYRQSWGYYGGYAKSAFSVSGQNAQTWYDFASSSYPYASVSESLTSRYASNIYASGYASSNRGDIASGYIDVYSPSNNAYLSNYWNNAYGTSSNAQVNQSASYASANSYYGSIKTDMRANNYWDTSEVYAKQSYYPVLSKYPLYSNWYGTAYANRNAGQTDAYQSLYGYGWPIYTYEYAKKYGWSAISRSQNNYGTHGLGLDAYTRSSSQGVKYPHFV